MRNFTLIGLLLFAHVAYSQNIARVLEYKPAPGQHINIEQIGTPHAAQNMAESETSLVSLGSFGGYMVLEFDQPCENDAENPYGVDFTVFGNAFSGSSEPGVIWVMQDENQNGLPDDTWYEIAGSHHFYSKTERNYEITYYKTLDRDVLWKDKNGNSGIIKANTYNTQEYYPATEYFPEYPHDSVSFSGTKLKADVALSGSQEFSTPLLDFGYADNHPKKQGINMTVPDNPYSAEIEGSGGDPIDISWAVNSQGEYVQLEKIHFIKIATGYLANLGRLGEASTDVAYVVDVEANANASGKENLLVVYHPPSKLLPGDSTVLEASYFLQGKLSTTEPGFSSSNSAVVEVLPDGILTAKNAGTVMIEVSAGNEKKELVLEVVMPDSISILADLSAVYPGDTILLDAQIFDSNGELIETEISFSGADSAAGQIIQTDGEYYFVADTPGEFEITCSTNTFYLQKSVAVKVFSEDDEMQIYFTIQGENENLFPQQWIEVEMTNINPFVGNRTGDYTSVNRLTLAHAVLTGLQKANLNFAFRDDESSGNRLYLYSVENEGLFYYGWGGQTEPKTYARVWIARLNSNHYLNDFNEMEISDGDSITLYHVSDITSPWSFSRLSANKDSAAVRDVIELKAEQTTCSFENGIVSEAQFSPINNQEIVAGESYFTNETGDAEIVLDLNPPWIISSGNSAILIHKKVATSASAVMEPAIRVYPNPVIHHLHIEGLYPPETDISILNTNGAKIFQQKVDKIEVSWDISQLTPGIYFLKIESNAATETVKFIKN